MELVKKPKLTVEEIKKLKAEREKILKEKQIVRK